MPDASFSDNMTVGLMELLHGMQTRPNWQTILRLTAFFDYALRTLMYACASGDRLVTIEETAEFYGLSRGHLMKIVNRLTRTGYLRGVRGRTGGFALARPSQDINLGALARATEPDFALVECFGSDNGCVITGTCRLPSVLNEALASFIATLDRYTLADIMPGEHDFFGAGPPHGAVRGPVLPTLPERAVRRQDLKPSTGASF